MVHTLTDEKKDRPVNAKQADADVRVPLHLVPPILVVEVAAVMREGIRPGRWAFNWRDSETSMNTYLSATYRHLMALLDGEDIDQKSGLPHLACIAANCGIMMDAKAVGSLVDDRHKKSAGIPRKLREYSKQYQEQAAASTSFVTATSQQEELREWTRLRCPDEENGRGGDCGDHTCTEKFCVETRIQRRDAANAEKLRVQHDTRR